MSKAKRKIKFNNSWKDTYTWIIVVRGDEFSANCNNVTRNFQYIMVVSHIRQHKKTDKHVKNQDLMKGQRGFMNDSFQLSGSSSPSLTNHEKVCKAELLKF